MTTALHEVSQSVFCSFFPSILPTTLNRQASETFPGVGHVTPNIPPPLLLLHLLGVHASVRGDLGRLLGSLLRTGGHNSPEPFRLAPRQWATHVETASRQYPLAPMNGKMFNLVYSDLTCDFFMMQTKLQTRCAATPWTSVEMKLPGNSSNNDNSSPCLRRTSGKPSC